MAHYYLAKAFGGNQWGAVHALLTMDYKNIGRAKMRKHIEANPEKFAAIVAEAREEYAKSQTGIATSLALSENSYRSIYQNTALVPLSPPKL